MARMRMTKQERSWVLYDVGNSAFVMLSTALIPVYFGTLAEEGSSVVVAWGYAETVASLLLALLMPILGSLADLAGNKKKFLVGFIGTGAVACAALGIPQTALPFLIIYVVSSIMLNGSMVFYDAFLVDATTEDRYDMVSSSGYAWGYIVHPVHPELGRGSGRRVHRHRHGHGHEGGVRHHGGLVGGIQRARLAQRASDAFQGAHGAPVQRHVLGSVAHAQEHRA